jgi:hypothetical protein
MALIRKRYFPWMKKVTPICGDLFRGVEKA